MSDIEYVFWDSDNTLVHTAEHHWRKHVVTLAKYGITLTEEHRQEIYTNNGRQNWDYLDSLFSMPAGPEEYLDEIDSWYFDHIDEIKLRSGIAEALEYFERRNIPQCVVSNGRKRSVLAALEAKKIAPKMEFIITIEDCDHRKPHPDPFLKALQKMEKIKNCTIDPQTCLAVDDDPLGVQSAEAAGMHVIYRPLGKDNNLLDTIATLSS